MRIWAPGLAVAFGVGAAVLGACGVASAEPDSGPRAEQHAAQARPHREARPAPAQRRATLSSPASRVSVSLPPLPVRDGASFSVSDDAIAARAADYVDAGGDPSDTPRFFFGDLAIASLDALSARDITAQQTRTELGNLTVSGYFGGLWLRDNLRVPAAAPPPTSTAPADLTVAAIGIGVFDAFAAGLTGAAAGPVDWAVRGVAHASIPVLLALYGYNRGYLEVLLDNPPPGVTPAPGSLDCAGFLNCSSDAFPLEIATRYDAALDRLAAPQSLAWWEMAAWTAILQTATGAGRFVWELIAAQGAFSPASYEALVELSSAYLMVSRAVVLSSMLAYADGDTELARSSLRLQAGLWMWSGSYFGGLASGARAGTTPAISVS